MDVIVEDTNILIDLFNTGLIRYCQLMGIEFHTTGYVINEIEDHEQRTFIIGYIINGLLKVDSFEGDDYVLLVNTKQSFEGQNNLSDADCSVMLLAERLHCRLLTADQKLVRQARERGLEVNGFLWLTDKMVEMGIVEPAMMAECLLRYKDTNPRVKEPETTDRINQYRDNNNKT